MKPLGNVYSVPGRIHGFTVGTSRCIAMESVVVTVTGYSYVECSQQGERKIKDGYTPFEWFRHRGSWAKIARAVFIKCGQYSCYNSVMLQGYGKYEIVKEKTAREVWDGCRSLYHVLMFYR